MIRRAIPALVFLPPLVAACVSPARLGQSDLMVGYHGVSSHYAEVGWSLRHSQEQISLYNATAQGYALSTEVRLDRDVIMGFEASAWRTFFGFEAGASSILYTNFDGATVRLRPQLGFGSYNWRLLFGYNIPLGPALDGLNTFDIGLRGHFSL